MTKPAGSRAALQPRAVLPCSIRGQSCRAPSPGGPAAPTAGSRAAWGGTGGRGRHPVPPGCAPHPHAGTGTARRGGRRVGALAGAGRVPLRPPVPPQRHDCPQLGGGRRRDCPQLRRRWWPIRCL
ncbi:hypothetical protein D1J63_24775 [Streptomyces sp. KPB2]|nr:hypothetical protein D1J63_24775 [Streptomyces sp. KPB2]